MTTSMTETGAKGASTMCAVPAPACAVWCTEGHKVEGWDEVGRDTFKFCRQEIAVACDGREDAGRVVVERYVSAVDGRIEIDPVEVRVELVGAFQPDDIDVMVRALRVASDLARLGDRGEPREPTVEDVGAARTLLRRMSGAAASTVEAAQLLASQLGLDLDESDSPA